MPTNTTTYSFQKPVVGADEDAWGGYLNGNWDKVDDLFDGTVPVTGIDINSGTLDGVTIGGTTAGAGTFTTLTANTSITGTLATAAQPNVTSVGSLTSLDVQGTVTADGLTVDGRAVINGSGFSTSLYALTVDTTFDRNGLEVLAGNSGIGKNIITAQNHDGTKSFFNVADSGDISFYEDTGTTAKFFWDASAERLGLGTTSPLVPLQVNMTDANFGVANLSTGVVQLGSTSTADDIAFGTIGAGPTFTEYMRIDNGTGNVGIGTSSPDGTLHIKDAIAQLYLQSNDGQPAQVVFGDVSDASRGRINYDSSDNLIFEVNNLSERMRIDSSGNVGIGTSSPAYPLDVSTNSSTTNDAVVVARLSANTTGTAANNFGAALNFSGEDASGSLRDLATINGIYTNATNRSSALTFKTRENLGALTERMRIDASGRVKIGTTSNTPASAGTAGIVFGDNTAGTAKAGVASFAADGSAPLLLTRLTSDGNVLGIADATTTRGLLRVVSSNFAIQGNNNLVFSTGGSNIERMRIDGSGNLLVGKTSIGTSTDGFEARAGGITGVSDTSGAALYVNRNGSDGDMVIFQKVGSTVGSIGNRGTQIYIETPTKTGLDFAGDILPRYNGSLDNGVNVDLGSSGYRFKDLYLSGGVYLGGTVELNGNKITGIEVTIADDAFATITPTGRRGGYISIVAQGDDLFPQHPISAFLYSDFGNSPFSSLVNNGGNFQVSTAGPPTGTTGTDGKVTLFTGGTSGTFYLENRYGSTTTFQITLM